jgi:hypothetical protein
MHTHIRKEQPWGEIKCKSPGGVRRKVTNQNMSLKHIFVCYAVSTRQGETQWEKEIAVNRSEMSNFNCKCKKTIRKKIWEALLQWKSIYIVFRRSQHMSYICNACVCEINCRHRDWETTKMWYIKKIKYYYKMFLLRLSQMYIWLMLC